MPRLLVGLFLTSGIAAGEVPFRYVCHEQEFGAPRLDRSYTGHALKIGNKEFKSGLGVHAPCIVRIEVHAPCRQFCAEIGMDQGAKQNGEAIFIVRAGSKELYRSGILKKGMAPVSVCVDLPEDVTLELVVDSAGIVLGDHADWADARFVLANGKSGPLRQGFADFTSAGKSKGVVNSLSGARVCNVKDFGAAGDGKTDDSPAFQQAVTALVRAEKGVLFIPAGDYRLGHRVELTFAGKKSVGGGLVIRGEGPGVSNVYGDNPDGALRFHDTRCLTQFTVRDLSFYAMRPDSGTALDISSPVHGTRNYRTLNVIDVDVRGDNFPSNHCFRVGINAYAQWRPLFRNVVVSSSPATDDKRSSPNFGRTLASCGIAADWCYAPAFEHCYVWGAKTGYRMICSQATAGTEDIAFHRCFAVGCSIGIDVQTPVPEPQLVIDACHLNCSQIGIRLVNRKYFHITNNLLYAMDGSSATYTDILLSGRSHTGLISNNIFHSIAPDNLRPAPPSSRINIHVAKGVHHLRLMNNIFNAKGQTIVVEKGARAITGQGNTSSNAHAPVPQPFR